MLLRINSVTLGGHILSGQILAILFWHGFSVYKFSGFFFVILTILIIIHNT